MSQALEILVWALLATGALFTVIGGIGLLRLPDFYTRVHAVSVTDTLGVALILLGCAFEAEFLVVVKLVTIGVFIYITGPAATHALAKAAYASGLKVEGEQEDRRALPL